MADVDPVKERQRLTAHYSSMMDGELEELAQEGGQLTEIAREALGDEIRRRELGVEVQPPGRQSPPAERRKPVPLRIFRDSTEAQLARTIVESASIHCFLADEHVLGTDWAHADAISGIKLWVNEEDAEAASALLESKLPAEDAEESREGMEIEQAVCPKCHSTEIFFDCPEVSVDSTVAADPYDSNNPQGVAGAPTGIWKCDACGHEWQDDEAENSSS